MNIEKFFIANLNEVYAVTLIKIKGKNHFLAATEGKGRCLLFSPPVWEESKVWDGPGGTVSIVPIKDRSGEFLAIQNFLPIFQSENAGIVFAKLNTKTISWSIKRVINLPFVHRIEIIKISKVPYVVASTLCGGKDFQDDWSKPGKVYIGPIPEDRGKTWFLESVLEGISKNHGMSLATVENHQVILITGTEGVFLIRVPETLGKRWMVERLMDHEVSDVYMYDIDKDGKKEMITIEPFHGNELAIYKFLKKRWEKIFSTSIKFGHVVWSGEILGKSSIILGNRGGEKDLILFQLDTSSRITMKAKTIDTGIGPTQISVVNNNQGVSIFSANHSIGEVALYRIT